MKIAKMAKNAVADIAQFVAKKEDCFGWDSRNDGRSYNAFTPVCPYRPQAILKPVKYHW